MRKEILMPCLGRIAAVMMDADLKFIVVEICSNSTKGGQLEPPKFVNIQ